MVHFCGSFPRLNPWTWKIVLGLRLDILLSDCNAACSWEFEIWDMVLIMVKHQSSNIARPSTRTALNVPWAFDLHCSFLLDHKCSYVWWFDPRREIKDLGSIPLPHRWCFHPLQLGGKAGNSHFWSLPNHLFPFLHLWFLSSFVILLFLIGAKTPLLHASGDPVFRSSNWSYYT